MISRSAVGVVLSLLLFGCGSDQGPAHVIRGTAQKGPFQIGSTVLIQELDDHLLPTGVTLVSQTSDAFGSFEGLQSVHSRFVEIVVSGYFLQEFGGAPGTTTLRAYADLEPAAPPCGTGSQVNVNVLTHLQGPRLSELVSKGASFAVAETQSRGEVLAAFHMPVQDAMSFQCMDLDRGRDADTILLAVADLATQAGSRKHQSSDMVVSDMTLFLNETRVDIADNGLIDDAPNLANLQFASYVDSYYHYVNGVCGGAADTVNDALETYYQQNGGAYTALPYWDFLDADWDGVINRDDPTSVPACP